MMNLNKLQNGIVYEKILENKRLKNFFDLYFKYKESYSVTIPLYSSWYFNYPDNLADCGEYILVGLNPIYMDESESTENIYSMNLMFAQVALNSKKVIGYLNMDFYDFLKIRNSTLELRSREKMYIYPVNLTEEQQLKYINILCNSK